MKRYYGIVARVNERALVLGAWGSGVDVPTFFLDADVQGIITVEDARRVARKVIDPLGILKILSITVTPPEDL